MPSAEPTTDPSSTTTSNPPTSSNLPTPNDRSPSPPPPLPLPSTPGARATQLQKLYTQALNSTLKSIPYTSFTECFPLIAANAEPALRGMHGGMIGRLREFAIGEFEGIMEERKVVEGLNGLDGLVERARVRGREESVSENYVPPHTLPPAPLLRAHTTPLHIAQNSQLNARLQTTQSQNATLIEEIRRQREEIEMLMAGLERVVGDVDAAGDVLGSKVGDLSGEAREARGLVEGE